MRLVIDPEVLRAAFLEGRKAHSDFAFKIIELLKLIKGREESADGLPEFHLEIFISYKSEDFDKVSYIEEALREGGHKVWLDKVRLEPGEPWAPAMERAIEKSDVFLYCLSRNSKKRERTVQNEELNLALRVQRKVLSTGKYIIPLSLEKTDLPEEVKGLDRVDFYEESGWHQLMTFLKEKTNLLARIQKEKEEEERALFLCEDEPPSRYSESMIARRYREMLGGNEIFDDWYKDVRETFSAFEPVSGTGFPAPILSTNSCWNSADRIFVTVAVGASGGQLVSELGVTKECLEGHLPGNCQTVLRLCAARPDKVLSVESAIESLKLFERSLREHIDSDARS